MPKYVQAAKRMGLRTRKAADLVSIPAYGRALMYHTEEEGGFPAPEGPDMILTTSTDVRDRPEVFLNWYAGAFAHAVRH